MRDFRAWCACAVLLSLACRAALGAILHVDARNLPGPGTGTEADPFIRIQDAIDAAESGDIVDVAPGTYLENLVMKSCVRVMGAGPAVTTIRGAASVSGVVLFQQVSKASLSGFTITVDAPLAGTDRGVAFRGAMDETVVLERCVITGVQYGIDILVWSPSSPTIRGNTLIGDRDETGIYIGNVPCAPVIRDNIIVGYGFSGISVFPGDEQPVPIVEFNDLWQNGTEFSGSNYWNFPDLTGTEGNISADPGFLVPGDHHLGSGSPCVDAGSTGSPPDPDGTRADMGALSFDQALQQALELPGLEAARIRIQERGWLPRIVALHEGYPGHESLEAVEGFFGEFFGRYPVALEDDKAYLENACHVLWTETRGRLPWSIRDLTSAQGRFLTELYVDMEGWGSQGNGNNGSWGAPNSVWSIGREPISREWHKGWAPARKIAGAAADPEAAVEALVGWLMKNFFHAYVSPGSGEDWGWEEYGEDVSDWEIPLEDYFRERIIGCHGGAKILCALLRSLAIPSQEIHYMGHGIAYLPTLERYVHGDYIADFAVLPNPAMLVMDLPQLETWILDPSGYMSFENNISHDHGFHRNVYLRRRGKDLFVARVPDESDSPDTLPPIYLPEAQTVRDQILQDLSEYRIHLDGDWYYSSLVPVRTLGELAVLPGRLAVEPAALDHGEVLVGLTGTRALTLRNAGLGELEVRRIALESPTGEFAGIDCSSVAAILSPGSEMVLEVAYAPADAGEDIASLRIDTGDPETPSLTVPLRGEGKESEPGVPFVRGDSNADGSPDIADAVTILLWLFVEGIEPGCERSADVDDGGDLNVTDAIRLLNFLFLGGGAPPAPFPTCGRDETPDHLGCLSFPSCG